MHYGKGKHMFYAVFSSNVLTIIFLILDASFTFWSLFFVNEILGTIFIIIEDQLFVKFYIHFFQLKIFSYF